MFVRIVNASLDCGHELLYQVAVRTPDHGAIGTGERHRRSPTGGCAKGTPR